MTCFNLVLFFSLYFIVVSLALFVALPLAITWYRRALKAH